MEPTLSHKVKEALASSTTDKVIIYVRSQSDAIRVGKDLHVDYAHAGKTKEQIDDILGRYRRGEIRVVVSTPLLGVALDLPDIKWAFHLSYPYNMVSYIQESGRPARLPGTTGFSTIIAPERRTLRKGEQPNRRPDEYDTPDRFGSQLVQVNADQNTFCRRLLMQLLNDGVAEPCTMMRGSVNLCDVCKSQMGVCPERSEPCQLPTELFDLYYPHHLCQ
jgi:superfamily II DNA helicase RecQ